MALLLSLAQQQAIKKISPNWASSIKNTGGTTNYDQLAQEIQDFYLGDLLGDAFAYDLEQNPSNYTDLLDGSTFTDCNDNTVYQRGLRYCLAYWNHGKYISDSMVDDTFTGFVQKNRQETQTISSGQITRLQQDSRNQAEKAWNVIKEYLDENTDTYTLWNCSKTRKPYQPRQINVQRTTYGKETIRGNGKYDASRYS